MSTATKHHRHLALGVSRLSSVRRVESAHATTINITSRLGLRGGDDHPHGELQRISRGVGDARSSPARTPSYSEEVLQCATAPQTGFMIERDMAPTSNVIYRLDGFSGTGPLAMDGNAICRRGGAARRAAVVPAPANGAGHGQSSNMCFR